MAPRATRDPLGGDRITQDVTDVSASSQLLRYAVAGQLDRLLKARPDLSQAKIAHAAGLGKDANSAKAVLSHALRDGPNAEQVMKLDEVMDAVGGVTGLSSLYLRLSGDRPGTIARVPASWMGSEGQHASSELEVLAEGAALLSAFGAAARVDARSVGVVSERYGYERMKLLVRRLIIISASPPTSRNYDAQIMLGSLASYAFEPMREWLDTAVRYFPLAFRVWRSITKLLALSRNGGHTASLQDWLQELVDDSAQLREASLYPGRSLDLELALAIPAAWSPAGNDWAGQALLARARNNEATIRERGTAAMGLWQRAVEQDRGAEVERDLRQLVAEFRKPESRPDAAAGLRWVAATLELAMDSQVAVCNEWPDVDEPWFRHVQRAADELDRFAIPPHLRAGTKNLFLHIILQNAGVYRRHAIETIVASGMTAPVARALGSLLRNEGDEAWLRLRAEFALGFLQQANRYVEEDLTNACLAAYKNLRLADLADGEKPVRSRVTEVHASLFAVADCFGVTGAEARARSARERLRPVLVELADVRGARAADLRRAARAAAYLLTVTAQPREGAEPDLSEALLGRLQDHKDEVTARLSRWALSFRFAPDGSVRPLLDAADYEKTFDDPWAFDDS